MPRSWLKIGVVGTLCVIAAAAWAKPVRVESGAIEGSRRERRELSTRACPSPLHRCASCDGTNL